MAMDLNWEKEYNYLGQPFEKATLRTPYGEDVGIEVKASKNINNLFNITCNEGTFLNVPLAGRYGNYSRADFEATYCRRTQKYPNGFVIKILTDPEDAYVFYPPMGGSVNIRI